jgi:hypothetical protein
MKRHRRKQIIVDRKFQVGTSLMFAVWALAYVILVSVTVVMAPVLVRLVSGDTLPTVGEIWAQFVSIHSRLLIPVFLSLVLLAVHWTILLHRIAGPAYRFKVWLKGVREGDLMTECRLRKGDHLKDVATEMTETLAAIRADVAKAKNGDLSALDKYVTEKLPEDEEPAPAVEEPVKAG